MTIQRTPIIYTAIALAIFSIIAAIAVPQYRDREAREVARHCTDKYPGDTVMVSVILTREYTCP